MLWLNARFYDSSAVVKGEKKNLMPGDTINGYLAVAVGLVTNITIIR